MKSSSISESPGKRGWPVTISGMIVPTDQMSTGTEYCLPPRRISGARYHSVTTSCVYVRSGTVKARARPKSASLSVPCFGSTSTFCGFRSRWKMRWEWHHERPLSIWYVNDLMHSPLSLYCSDFMYFLRSKSQYSKHR